ncbi:hypothetical protein [Streptomyces virginiae]|uniref:hypothetical protein n=1 Tax=Streptomyces virginiae TaxID=1961 RepID=UPI003667CEA5
MTLIVPVKGDGIGEILVADLTGQGPLALPTGDAEHTDRILPGVKIYTLVIEEVTQMRRRKVTTRVLVTLPVVRGTAYELRYRDPRAVLRVEPSTDVIEKLPERTGGRLALGLQSLLTGQPTYIRDGAFM